MTRRRGTAWPVALVAALVAAAVATAAPSRAQDRCDGVWVMVDATALGGEVTTRCAPGDPASGLEALRGAGHSYSFVPRQPGLVCTIDARPDPCNGAPEDAYWSYWHAPAGGSWTYSNRGAGNRDPEPGTAEGWAFGAGDPPRRPPPAAPAPAPPPDQAPAQEPAEEPAEEPADEPAESTTIAPDRPAAGTHDDAPDAGRTGGTAGSTTADDDTGAPVAPSPVGTPQPTASPPASPPSAPAVTADATLEASPTGSPVPLAGDVDTTTGAGRVGLLAGGALIVVVAAGAAVRARRRRLTGT